MSLPPDDILSMIPYLARQQAEQDRRNRNRRRKGKIVEENPSSGLYRVEFRAADGDSPAFKSPWLRVKSMSAGGVRIQCEPTIGQWVEVVSESGEMTDGWIEMSDFYEGSQRPHGQNGELATDVSGGAYRSVLAKDGSETTKATERVHNTDGDVIFNTGGVVRFN